MCGQRHPVSVLVLARDEESLIERCLDSLQWADEIVLIDSGSQDRTPELARSRGAVVVHQPWLGWPQQRAAAARAATHDWVLFIEADEAVTPELRQSIEYALRCPNQRDGYSVDRRTDFLGVLLPNDQRRANIYSFVRLFHREFSAYDPTMVVHERVVVSGRTHLLDGALLHWRSQSLAEYTSRLLGYAPLEADLLERQGVRSHSRNLVIRPLARVAWLLFFRGELRFGTLGLLHALHKSQGDWVRQTLLWSREHCVANEAEVLSAAHLANDAKEERHQPRHTLTIWLAPLRLFGIALVAVATKPDPLLLAQQLQSWTSEWLNAGKQWERLNVTPRLHPPAAAYLR